MANLIEEGDEVVIGTAGVFGTRMVEVATRLGAKVHQVDAEWGRIVEPERIEPALKAAKGPSWSRSCTPRLRPEFISRSRKSRRWRTRTAR